MSPRVSVLAGSVEDVQSRLGVTEGLTTLTGAAHNPKGSTMTDTIRISSAADLVAAVPQMMGFNVGDSLVVVGLAEGGTLAGLIRFDPETPAETFAEAMSTLARRKGSHAVVVAYGPESSALLGTAVAAATAANIEVNDHGRVDAGQWVSDQTGQRATVPGFHEGLPVPAYSRQALAESMAPHGTDQTEAALDAATPPHDEQVPAAIEAWAALLTGRVEPETPALVAALPLLERVDYRDLLAAALIRDQNVLSMVDNEHTGLMREALPKVTEDVLTALRGIIYATPAKHAPDVLAVAGMAHLSVGNATHTGILAEEALKVDPTHRLSMLLQTMAEHGMELPASA